MTWSNRSSPSRWVPGLSQNVVPGGFALVLTVRSFGTAESTVTAPAGAVAGPAGGFAQTAAVTPAGAVDDTGPGPVCSPGSAEHAASRAAAPSRTARRRIRVERAVTVTTGGPPG